MTFKTVFCAAVAAAALTMSGGAALAGIVTNPSFEGGTPGVMFPIPGWTVSGPGTGGVCLAAPTHTGVCAPVFESVNGYGSISQTVTTTPGQAYELSLWVWNNFGSDNDLKVFFGGVEVLDLAGLSAQDFTLYTTIVTATSASMLLDLQGYNIPGFLLVDDVDLTPIGGVPEPMTMALLATGLLGFAGLRRRRARA